MYDGWNLIQETTTTDSGESTEYYVWGLDLSGSLQGAGGIGGLLMRQTDSGEFLYLYDANGNVGQLVDASTGSLAAQYEYDPFGNTLVANGPEASSNPFRFSTKYLDAETSLYVYTFRSYDPEMGRWWTRDPIGDFAFSNVQKAIFGQRQDEASQIHNEWLKKLSQKHASEQNNLYHFNWNNPSNTWDYLGLGNEWYSRGRCCNLSKCDEWVLATEGAVGSEPCARWRKLAPGECLGGWSGNVDCEGMTCGGGFYSMRGKFIGVCITPGRDVWPMSNRRWTPSDDVNDKRSPRKRIKCPDQGDMPPGYDSDRCSRIEFVEN